MKCLVMVTVDFHTDDDDGYFEIARYAELPFVPADGMQLCFGDERNEVELSVCATWWMHNRGELHIAMNDLDASFRKTGEDRASLILELLQDGWFFQCGTDVWRGICDRAKYVIETGTRHLQAGRVRQVHSDSGRD